MDNDYGSGAAAGALALLYVVFVALWLVFALAIYVLYAFSLMSFFKKVGVEPWIGWVPVYNTWKVLEVGGQPGWLALISLIPYGGIVTAVFLYISMFRIGRAFGKDGAFLVLGIFLPFVWAFILGGKNEVYRPESYAANGWPLPLAGYGSARGAQPTPTAPAA
jgi:hypothetical protein